MVALVRKIHSIKPDVVLNYTIKPVVYGGIAARMTGVPSIYSLITGLGYSFMDSSIDTRSIVKSLVGILARLLYRISLRFSKFVFFQNPDDSSVFITLHLVRSEQAVIVNGSGVDLQHYAVKPVPDEPLFLLIARLIADKGIREYITAAMRVKERYPQARFQLAGALDQNPSSIKFSELQSLKESGCIEYLGYLPDVREALTGCRVYVLPSYREGTPRTVLEAMSLGRPIITTDSPGCRETVVLTEQGRNKRLKDSRVMEGENGFLVRPRDDQALESAMLRFLENPDIVGSMAKRSREIAELKYDVNKVNAILMSRMNLSEAIKTIT